MLSMAGPLFAQADSKDETIQKLLDRVEALERQVAALQQAEVQPGPAQQVAPQAAAATLVPTATAAGGSSGTASAADASAQPDTPTQPDNAGRFNFHGYADVDFQRNVNGTQTKKFDLGEIDLFGTERLSPHLTALMEVVFETDDQQLVASVPVNVERLLLQYRGNDFFNVDIGSYRTAIGYYSTAYLRGAWLQTAISRPKMFTFEDQGGFLPLHAVGVSVNGRIPSGDFNLHYVVETGSSRNYGDTAGLPVDLSFNRATNLAIYSQPLGVPGLEIGFSIYHDLLSPIAGVGLDRSLWMVHFVYVQGRVEFLNEGLRIKIADGSLGSGTGLGFYSQIAYRIASSWKPYARVEYLNAQGSGLVSTAFDRQFVPWETVYTGGVRHELTDSVAVKFELGRETDYLRPSYITAAAQLAFTF
jgi:hypothetical protein